VYRHSDGGGWHYVQTLHGNNGGNFGFSLAMHGEVLVVGAPNAYRTSLGNSNNANAIRTGMVTVFRMRDYNHFELDQTVQCTACSGVDRFGKALAVSGENKYGFRLLVGQKGEVHLYEHDSSRSGGYQWFSVGFLQTGYDATAAVSSFYGSALAVSGKTMLVGVKDHTSASGSEGSGRYAEAGTVVIMDTDDRSDMDVEAIYHSFHLDLYLCLYSAIVLGIAVILLVPLGMAAQWLLQDAQGQAAGGGDKNRAREHRPFLSLSSSTQKKGFTLR
jgi:hypothetical protein